MTNVQFLNHSTLLETLQLEFDSEGAPSCFLLNILVVICLLTIVTHIYVTYDDDI